MKAPSHILICSSCGAIQDDEATSGHRLTHRRYTGENRREVRNTFGVVVRTTGGSWVKCGPVKRYRLEPEE